jgi:DnaA-homolog protein
MLDQLALSFQLRDDATFENFYDEGNHAEILHRLGHIAVLKGEPFVYLSGACASGKTHLLQSACQAVSKQGQSAMYLSLDQPRRVHAEALKGIEDVALICIDDIDQIAGDTVWEEALFHLFNAIRLKGHFLLVSARLRPKDLNLLLPDLQSRLSSGLCYVLEPLTDHQKEQALQFRALKRGLVLHETVARFLLNHCPRDMAQLFSRLDILDKASLKAQRRLTIPFVKEVLDL